MGTNLNNDNQKGFALSNEVKLSIDLIVVGLGEFQKINLANDFYHLPFFLLSNGFERLMKTILCYRYYYENKKLPDSKTLPVKNYGHDLDKLLDEIMFKCFSENYLELKSAQDDLNFLREESTLKKLIEIFSDFNRGGRYSNLDIVFDKRALHDSPIATWGKLELKMFLQKLPPSKFDIEISELEHEYNKILQKPIIVLEMLTRSLVRLFTLNEMSEIAKHNSGIFKHFTNLLNQDFGKTDYNKIRTGES